MTYNIDTRDRNISMPVWLTVGEGRDRQSGQRATSSPIAPRHLDEKDLVDFCMTIRKAVKSYQSIRVYDLISSLPRNSALSNALVSLNQMSGNPSDADVQRIILGNNLNEPEQIAFVLVVQAGQEGLIKDDSKEIETLIEEIGGSHSNRCKADLLLASR